MRKPGPASPGNGLQTYLLLLLFAARFLYLGVIRFITWPAYPDWLLPSEEVISFLLIAALIYTSRPRLAAFHITPLALALIVLAPYLDMIAVVTSHFRLSAYDWLVRAIQAAIAVVLSVTFIRKREGKPSMGRDSAIGLAAATAAGLGLGFIFGTYFVVREGSSVGVTGWVTGWAQLAALVAFQLRGAAILEEPLFRGFGWGTLKDRGWRDGSILLTQALLFSVSHLYYLRFAFFSFLVLVPVVGISLGLLAWRTRSIATTMVTHALVNAVSIFWGKI